MLNEGEVYVVVIFYIVELCLWGDGEVYGYWWLVYCWDGFVGDGDFFVIYINSFNDVFVVDVLCLCGGGLFVYYYIGVWGGGLGGEYCVRE